MLISLFSAVAYAEESSAFVSGQYETTVGEDIEIELKATDSTGVVLLVCEAEYDDEFIEIMRFDDAKLIGGTLTAKTDESPLRLFWMDVMAKDNIPVEGTLGTFTFRALKAGKTQINVNFIEAFTKTGELVPFENTVIELNIKESEVPAPETKEYTIKASAGQNGKISPSGEVKTIEGKQLLFIFTPDSGYRVEDVKVDGESVGSVLEYTYESVNADSTIEVTFEEIASSGSSSSASDGSSSSTSSSSSSSGKKPGSSAGSSSSDKVKEDDENPSEEITEELTKEEPAKTEWINPFSDVNTDDWYYEYVKYINSKKLMNGMTETEFAPNNTVTRAMFVTVLYRLEKEPTSSKADFGDVPDGSYYENAVGWAVHSEIVNGITETEFAPDDTITREQMAAVIYRYMKYKGMDVSVGEEKSISAYDDFANISDYAIDAFEYACSKGIISGTSPTTLAPGESATRAQMAAIFQRCENSL